MVQWTTAQPTPYVFMQPMVTLRGNPHDAQQSCTLQGSAGDGNPERYTPGVEVLIGQHRFRCKDVLGRGSFSEVWAGECIGSQSNFGVALKDINCNSPAELNQALLEVRLIECFQGLATTAPGQEAPVMRIPRYIAHNVTQKRNGWRVRMAMSRVPGESLDSFLKRPQPPGQDGPTAVRRGCALAVQIIRQLAPSLERISRYAWHRDVNSHNILVGDATDGGPLRICGGPEESARRASFWLIDFGLAVESPTWPQQWPHSDVAGDCRYWPPSSFMVSFCGAEEMAANGDLLRQYLTRLDIVGLALTALEILCTIAGGGLAAAGADGVHSCWRRLLAVYECYREEVTRWHLMIYQVFSSGGDITPLKVQLSRERVVDKVKAHLARVRSQLQVCAAEVEDAKAHALVRALDSMLDERSVLGLKEVVEMVSVDKASVQCASVPTSRPSRPRSTAPTRPPAPRCPPDHSVPPRLSVRGCHSIQQSNAGVHQDPIWCPRLQWYACVPPSNKAMVGAPGAEMPIPFYGGA